MTFWVVVVLILGGVFGVALWSDRRARRRHTGGLRGSMRSGDDGLNDVMGKHYGGLNDHRPIDPTGGQGPNISSL